MTRDEAEEVAMAVGVDFESRYGITKAQYAEALLILAGPSGLSAWDHPGPRPQYQSKGERK